MESELVGAEIDLQKLQEKFLDTDAGLIKQIKGEQHSSAIIAIAEDVCLMGNGQTQFTVPKGILMGTLSSLPTQNGFIKIDTKDEILQFLIGWLLRFSERIKENPESFNEFTNEDAKFFNSLQDDQLIDLVQLVTDYVVSPLADRFCFYVSELSGGYDNILDSLQQTKIKPSSDILLHGITEQME